MILGCKESLGNVIFFEFLSNFSLRCAFRTTPPNDVVKETVEQSKMENKQCSVVDGEMSRQWWEVGGDCIPWQPPAVKPKSCDRGGKVVVTGLASLFKEKAWKFWNFLKTILIFLLVKCNIKKISIRVLDWCIIFFPLFLSDYN